MSTHLKEAEVKSMIDCAPAAVCLGYCAASYLFRPLEKVGYTCGYYGWNYDVYNINGVIACTGYRRMKGTYSDELDTITAKYETIAYKHAARNVWTRDEARDTRMKNYLLARWAREVKAAIKRKEGGKR